MMCTFLDENHFGQLQPLIAFQGFVVELGAREVIAGTDVTRLDDVAEMCDHWQVR